MILEPGRKCQFSVFGLFLLLCIGFQSFPELDDVSSGSRVRVPRKLQWSCRMGEPSCCPLTLKLGGGNMMLSGQAPGPRDPTLGRMSHHWRRKACMQGWAEEKHPHDLSLPVSFQTKLSWQLRATGVDLPTKSGGPNQGLRP